VSDIVSFFENTQNANPTKGMTLIIQAEISKKQTNFDSFASARCRTKMVHQ